MIKKFRSAQSWSLLVEIMLLFGLLIGVLSSSVPTQAAATNRPGAAPYNPAWYTCTAPISDVAVFNNRVHVRCSGVSPAISGVYWFAVPTTDSANASRYLSIFQTALLSGKTLVFWLDPNDTSGADWGCHASDCRAVMGAKVGP